MQGPPCEHEETLSVNVAKALPVVPVPVTVYTVEAAAAVGVPVINPVDVLKESPALNEGEIEY